MQDLKQLLSDCGALLDGHFQLTSGRHSDRYVEKFRLIEQPRYLDEAARAMVEGIDPDSINIVLGAAVGGILIAGAVARLLDRRTMFTERVNGVMTLRRGFELTPKDRVLIVEDIISTGGSVVELIDVAKASGATTVTLLSHQKRFSACLSPVGNRKNVPSARRGFQFKIEAGQARNNSRYSVAEPTRTQLLSYSN
jgi:orotate phosphoribosyltransferase